MSDVPYGKDFREEVLRTLNRQYGDKQTETRQEPKTVKSKPKIPWFAAGALMSKLANERTEKKKREKELLTTQQKILEEPKKKK